MRRRALFGVTTFVLFIGLAQPGRGDVVVPSDRVVVGVNIRASPSSASEILGLLRLGEQLPHLGSVPRWHRVQLENRVGFVSSGWTNVIHDPVEDEEPVGDVEPVASDEETPPGVVETPHDPDCGPEGGLFDFWLSEDLVRKLGSENTLMFPMNLTLTHRSALKSLSEDCEMHIVGEPEDPEDRAAPPAVVVEPPNLCVNDPPDGGSWGAFVNANLIDRECVVRGFPRIYDEHLVGSATVTNPHHMLEIHPALTIDCTGDGGGVLDATGFIAYHEGMREVLASSAATCFDTRLCVRRNASESRYEFRVDRNRRCGNFVSYELSVFDEFIRELGTGGHSALTRVRPENRPFETLKIYTYPGTAADDLIHSFDESADPQHGTFLHGMMTFDYFSIVRTVRTREGVFLPLTNWTEVPFPLAMVVFGEKEDPNPDEHE